MFTRVAVGGRNSNRVINLLIDTGASYTMLPFEILDAIGCAPGQSRRYIRITTANGYVTAPVVETEWFIGLRHRIDRFTVIAHTLPRGSPVDGLLGVDFLARIDATIKVKDRTIILP
jgi:predicted aspartyl protease